MARHHAGRMIVVVSIVLSIATMTPSTSAFSRLWSDKDSARPEYTVASSTYADGVDSEGYYKTYHLKLPPMPPGGIINTPGTEIFPLPPGHVSITFLTHEIVDENFNKVPENEVYNHHWAVFDPSKPFFSRNTPYYKNLVAKRNESIHVGPCELARSLYTRGAEGFEWGTVGEDSEKNLYYSFDDNYPYFEGEMGYIHEEDYLANMNIHIIDTRGVPPDQVQLCTSCNCQYLNSTNIAENGGGLQCCPNGAKCNSSLPPTAGNMRQYYLSIFVRWTQITPGKPFTPLHKFNLSLPSLKNNRCVYEYNTPLCVAKDGSPVSLEAQDWVAKSVCRGNYSEQYGRWKVNMDMDVVRMTTHMHLGAAEKGIITYLETPNANGTFTRSMLCHNKVNYGKRGTPKENLIKSISSCSTDLKNSASDYGPPMMVKKGDYLVTVAFYWANENPYVNEEGMPLTYGAPFDGVMSYVYGVFASPDGKFRLMRTADTDALIRMFADKVPEPLQPGETVLVDYSLYDVTNEEEEEEESLENEDEEEEEQASIEDQSGGRCIAGTGSTEDIRGLPDTVAVPVAPASPDTLFYRLDPKNSSRMTFALQYTSGGWGGLGFGDTGMIDLDVVLSDFVSYELGEYWSNDYGTPNDKLIVDPTGKSYNGISDCLMAEEGTTRYFQFSRPLSGAAGEFSNNVDVEIVYAMGTSDAVSYHGGGDRRGRISLAGLLPIVDKKNLNN